MNRLPLLAQRIFNVPLAIAPAKAELIIAALAERLGVVSLNRLTGERIDLRPMAFDDDDRDVTVATGAPRKIYEVVEGVAIIDIEGTLVQKTGYLDALSGMTGYDGIRQKFLTALTDPDVGAIALNINSPGGEVSGCFDLADVIFESRGDKPTWAILDDMAFSAAYAIASAADHITVPRTGGVGSVGVICIHCDFSKAISQAGLNVTFIQFGDRKTDGAPEKPLAKEALARFQADIDFMGELFVNTVARNRGLSPEAVRDTQATTFLGAAGVAVGLADAVMAPDAAFRELLSTLA